MSTREYRIETANLILDTFVPGVKLYDDRELRMCWDARKQTPPRHNFPARLRTDGSWPLFGYELAPTGGTGFQAIAQLIRYARDLSRLPVCSWQYWSNENIKLGNPKTIELILASDYGNPEKTKCVLCGLPPGKMKGLDWWSIDGVIGPCCSFGVCVDRRGA